MCLDGYIFTYIGTVQIEFLESMSAKLWLLLTSMSVLGVVPLESAAAAYETVSMHRHLERLRLSGHRKKELKIFEKMNTHEFHLLNYDS